MITAKQRRYSAALRIGVITLILIIARITTASADDLHENVYEKIIAHGGSTYHGYETTNSVEAINYAIQSGYKVIELDMELSSDNKIIMLHDWDRTAVHYYNTSLPKKISQRNFMKLSVHGKFEVLTFDKLAEILENNSEIRIVTDTKGNNLELLSIIKKEYPTLVKQIIPQIYDYDQWAIVKEMGYSDIIFTLYAMHDIEEEKLISFVKKNDIYAVTIPDYLVERGYCSSFSEQGIQVYVHTVSDYEDALQYMEQGAYGVYSGILLPEEFAGFEKDCYLAVGDDNGTVEKLTD
ncbi:MAG: glycerophosphodiester phosphodiesterase family protein, partial [Eubacteriales bacterium]|nr:glycerophosphodiester phosphodiesterase family protein [Eubacteriales bacterium]